jgi:hypothetical protein
MTLSATVLSRDSNIQQRASTIIVLQNVYHFTTHIHVAYSITNVLDNHKGYYTLTTIRVNHSFNLGNIISVLSSVNSVISDYKKLPVQKLLKIMYLEFNVINLYFALTGKIQTCITLLVVFMFH